MLLLADKWKEYELIDMGNGEKLERWGDYVLRRPDPQIMWPMQSEWALWKNPHGHYHRSARGGGQWEHKKKYPEKWVISYKNLKFNISPTGFKHTGLFPEQAANWDWAMDKIENAKRPIKVLNLFAYTGGATVACAAAGAEVCHVDASKGMVTWAKENIQTSGLGDRKVRFIVDDVVKFVEREVRRGNKYDAIIMDPPSYGRGPKGEVWQIEEKLYGLVELCTKVLSDEPLFFLINSYTTGLSPIILEHILDATVVKKAKGGKVYGGEIGIPTSRDGKVLPCGIFGRWESK
ncbi:class I SAM-dependent methyltransferase [[Clostridium] dakarense]|uniref:class I SAM-dependent methyltransferase n=1 Tax=Faecalimicrobium dakarense TaxID=1301100 RepID=UPI0004B265D6|nr:class I SAM-dependent methyltransferase [[Clostridium] dakarense]